MTTVSLRMFQRNFCQLKDTPMTVTTKGGEIIGQWTPSQSIKEKPIDKRQTDLVQACEMDVIKCDRCHKNLAQMRYSEDGDEYKICEWCAQKFLLPSQIKKLPKL